MCARYTLTLADYEALAELLGVSFDPASEAARLYRPRYNAAPGEEFLVLRHKKDEAREIVPARWGLIPRWAKDPAIAHKTVNARAETAHEKPAFRGAFASRRCIVPADGFYEWSGPKGARKPLWFHAPDGGLLYLGGLYETWDDPESGEATRTFTILTTPANDVVARVHDRMPALIDRAAVDEWLRGPSERARALLHPAPESALVPRRVSTRVNTTAVDDPSCLFEEPPERERAKLGETLSLFDLAEPAPPRARARRSSRR